MEVIVNNTATDFSYTHLYGAAVVTSIPIWNILILFWRRRRVTAPPNDSDEESDISGISEIRRARAIAYQIQ